MPGYAVRLPAGIYDLTSFPFDIRTRFRKPFLVPFCCFTKQKYKEFPMCPSKSPPIANRLLAALPKKDYQSLQRHLEEIPLVFEQLLYRPNVLITDVYFPNSGVISLLAGVNERSTLEVGLVGNVGMIGSSIFIGVDSSMHGAVVPGVSSAMKMKATTLCRECKNGRVLPRILRRYSHSVLTRITQSAVCNQFHSVDA